MAGLSSIGGAGWQFFDANGDPLSGGKLYTYLAGTTTPATTYTDYTATWPNTNPIILDSAGRVSSQIWLLDDVTYKFVLTTALDAQIWVKDHVPGILANQTLTGADVLFTGFNGQTGTVDDLAGDNGSDWIGFVPDSSSGKARSVQAKLRETVSVKDFGAIGDGIADDTIAVQAAINFVAPVGGAVYFPKGDYRLVGATGADGIVHGIQVPFTGGGIEGGAKSITLYGDGGESRLIGVTASMYVVRFIGNNSTIRDLAIIGNDTSSGLVLTSSNINADTGDEQISYNSFTRLLIGNCGENGILLQCPLGSSPGGVYYNNFSDIYIYYGGSGPTRKGRGIYMRELAAVGSNGSNNRNIFRGVTLKRLNTGVQIDDGDTNSFYSCHFEAINGTGGPNAVATAVKIGPVQYRSTQLNRFFGCQTESVTRGFENNDSRTELYGCDFRNNLMTVVPLTWFGGNDGTLQGTYFTGWARGANTRACSVDSDRLNANKIALISGTRVNRLSQTDFLGLVPGNSTVKTLTITFTTPLLQTQAAQILATVTFFGSNNGWNGSGQRRITSFGSVSTNKTTVSFTDDTTGSFGPIASYTITRTGGSASPNSITLAYTFNAGTPNDSFVYAVSDVVFTSGSPDNSQSFTMEWS